MPNEVEMNGFLYAILKQQDLKNVDWEAVAKDRMITNGHAARMRFSRFKSAQEGKESKPRKPRAPKETSAPRGAKARAAVKKTKAEKDKKKEKKELATPPATPIKSDREDEMAIDTTPQSGMERQLPLPVEPASFTIKPDPDMEQEVVQEMDYIKAEPDLASETSLESADFGQTVDMLGQVNIDNFSHPHFMHHSNPQIMSTRAMMTPEMSLSPLSRPETLQRARVTPELQAPIPIMGVGDRGLFQRHYTNGMSVLVQAPGAGSSFGNDFGGFEEYINECRSGREMVMDEGREPVVKEEQKWDEDY